MNPNIANYLAKIKGGKPRTFKNMAIMPLYMSDNGSVEYLMLKEALARKLLTITEVNQHGSVPELKVENKAETFVLLLDAEELMGAKQNRVLNTSVLLKPKSVTIIPVSCTEQGRWQYKSAAFYESGIIMSHELKTLKMKMVTDSLHDEKKHMTDQLDLWVEIEKMHTAAAVDSPTGAMRDVHRAKSATIDEYESAFPHVPRQRGSLIFINGNIVGFEMLSNEESYQKIHSKLVRSYALGALLQQTQQGYEVSKNQAKAFLREVVKCDESRFAAVGQGDDYRFEGPGIVGSALVVNDQVVHIAFLKGQF